MYFIGVLKLAMPIPDKCHLQVYQCMWHFDDYFISRFCRKPVDYTYLIYMLILPEIIMHCYTYSIWHKVIKWHTKETLCESYWNVHDNWGKHLKKNPDCQSVSRMQFSFLVLTGAARPICLKMQVNLFWITNFSHVCF